MNRILVCGGRNFNNKEFLFNLLNDFNLHKPVHVLIHGDAKGADTLAKLWAEDKGLPVIAMKANWNHYHTRGGSVRNSWMLTYAMPTEVIAFPGGVGTADMIRRAEAVNLKVWKIET